MKKDLKKCYHYLDLHYNATIEQIQTREKALIRILNVKEKEKNVSLEKEKKLVNEFSEKLINNIKNNGTPKEPHYFESNPLWVLIALMTAAMICFFSFYAYI